MIHQPLVLGGEHAGRALAERLLEEYESVTFIDENEAVVAHATERGIDARVAAFDEPQSLRTAWNADADAVIVVGRVDPTNLLLTQASRTTFDVDRVTVLVNDPQNTDVFEDLGVEVICVTSLVTDMVVGSSAEPAEDARAGG
ncbi:TrkA family potassium uptake protein [Haloferax sp. Atlit-10N]|uniref:NAD-binding protein n=1 Tax=Haloferax TaxID=2251 RepID=UPI000679A3E6|nr:MULTISPECIES: NAD-binding protein [Haloferax]RDZ45914.1 TrkA family potassium uptake protein [Haloferax sp. Atlit-19N]RDZ46814.1 TrkA family potassium uptake protein [Haloferax sp. Atlit-16N]RDZ60646.1 TrkA family potassium uptake protein [Haloferax sp. Atlit-10N]